MLILHFIKSNGTPVGLKVMEDGNTLYEDVVKNHSKFNNPWDHCLHKLKNYVSRVHPNSTITFPEKVVNYLCSLNVNANLYPSGVEACKRSLFHSPMVLAESKGNVPAGQDFIIVTNGIKIYCVYFI